MAGENFGQLLGADTDPAPLMQRIAAEALDLVHGAQGAAVLLARGGCLTFVSASGVWSGRLGTFVARDDTVLSEALGAGCVVHCDDLSGATLPPAGLPSGAPARSLVSVPLHRDGVPIGVLAVVSQEPRAFTRSAVRLLKEVSGVVAVALASVLELTHAMSDTTAGEFMARILTPGVVAELTGRERLERVIDAERLHIVTQPIVDLERGRLVGVEALARFPEPPIRAPDVWFREAHDAGLGVELQVLAVQRALELLDGLPAQTALAINAGPDALTSPELLDELLDAPPERIVIELTEHLALEDYADLGDTLGPLRRRGFRLAIDDVGAGFSSFRHVLSLKPDMVKLDRHFTTDIDRDPRRQAMAESLMHFSRATGTDVYAEGIETEQELAAIRGLGIRYGQGYLLARPGLSSALPERFDMISRARGPAAPA